MKLDEIAKLASIRGIESLGIDQIRHEIYLGGRFVRFPFCISVIVLTFRNTSPVFFVRAGESAYAVGLRYFLLSLVLGWWGIPFGPIFTIQSLFHFARGGKNVTDQTVAILENPPLPFYDYCPGCARYAAARVVCTKHGTALQAYPEQFYQRCNGKDFEPMPLLLPTQTCFVCGARVSLNPTEQKGRAFSCSQCNREYNYSARGAA